MPHLMIDLETAGKRYDAPILAVGAAFFDLMTGEIGKTFYGAVDPADAFRFGKPDGDTFRWWMRQEDAAREAAVKGTYSLETVLNKFREFYLSGPADVCVWGNGATFDISILDYAFPRATGQESPWKFWLVRDCRTIKALAQGLVKERKLVGTAHNALDDAKHQAAWVSDMWQVLRGTKAVPPKREMVSDDLLG